ncbi:hypothetical protein [Haloplasma contractile]|uniref:Membrane lipoprotein n=1 Tax=Haloplasma contractile SSD-17B TaxID=1033810 RepID=U2FL28_9MOLU|nr:hypothetical protein [Haloplasma contractile]ERJ11914.1 membrane lipoprotein [Haloplasma contractile SSD-17B]
MKFRLLLITILSLTSLLLTGCQNDEVEITTETTDEEYVKLQADYEYFQSLDFSDETIYFDPNFYIHEDEHDINWYEVIGQNKEVSDAYFKLDYRYKSLDDSSVVTYVHGKKSHLTLTYDDGHHPVATKDIPVVYLDVGSFANIEPRLYGFTHRFITVHEKDYKIEFKTYNDDYYGVWFSHMSDEETDYVMQGDYRIANEDFRYNEKYTGPKTYYIEGTPVLKIWKVEMGYRVGVLDPNDYTTVITDYYVYSVDMDHSRSHWFFHWEKLLSLRDFYSEFNYEIDYIEYDPILDHLEVRLQAYNEDKTIHYNETYTVDDYYTQLFSKDDLDYDIEITRVDQQIVNITFIHKKLDDYEFSYTLEANRTKD